MKEIIMTVLNRWKQRNIDFTSEKVRTELAEEIEVKLYCPLWCCGYNISWVLIR